MSDFTYAFTMFTNLNLPISTHTFHPDIPHTNLRTQRDRRLIELVQHHIPPSSKTNLSTNHPCLRRLIEA
jgi:hypothetical protein